MSDGESESESESSGGIRSVQTGVRLVRERGGQRMGNENDVGVHNNAGGDDVDVAFSSTWSALVRGPNRYSWTGCSCLNP